MTSSSSGHSGDDKWYDLQELDPPPVPQKNNYHISRSSSSTHTNSNNTFPCSPKRNNSYQLSHHQPHNHYTVQHNKLHVSNSLPLQHVNVSQPLSAVLHSNIGDIDVCYKMEKNNILKQHNERLRQESDYMVTRVPKVCRKSLSITLFSYQICVYTVMVCLSFNYSITFN